MRKGLLLTLIVALTLLPAAAFAGDPDTPPGSPEAGSGMPSLQALYDYLTTGASPAGSGSFEEPSAAPAPTMKTLKEIYEDFKSLIARISVTPEQVLSGQTFFSTDGAWGPADGTMPDNGAVRITPGRRAKTIAAGYHNGSGKVVGDTDLSAANIKKGVTIFGVTGTAAGSTGNAADANVLKGRTYSNDGGSSTGTMPDNGAVSITPGMFAKPIPAGYHNGSGAVVGDINLNPINIRSGVTIFGVTGVYNACSGVLSSGGRWCKNNDGTVTDMTTGLIWLQNPSCLYICKSWFLGICTTMSHKFTWDEANEQAAALKNGRCGLTDESWQGLWRLPSEAELYGVTHGSECIREKRQAPFTGIEPNSYWTTTPRSSGYVIINLSIGSDSYWSDATGTFSAWPVRRGTTP